MAGELGRSRANIGGARPIMEPLPASFYGAIDKKNPVVASFEAEVREVLGFLRKIRQRRPLSGDQQQHHEEHRRGASTLFNIWNKYKTRLPAFYYYEKLLKVGEELMQIKEYKLALLQCYSRYLQQFTSANIEALTDVSQFKSTFFPNGLEDTKARPTFLALQGRSVCIYEIVKANDPNLLNQDSIQKCLSVLSFLRLNMQVVLPFEHLCWLIYNGAVNIYNICRFLMSAGHSAKALEFLLWASVCMESSIPLLAIHYLTWRATLYTAVCQCYFDCKASVHGEVFARRALCKIDELNQLERMADSPHCDEAKKAFTEATTKVALMIFKRAVFESRRKPKGVLRPKLKANLKDTEKSPWPRSATERLLIEMFVGSAAHFLAILEALSRSNVRGLLPITPVPDEPEIQDVNAELLFAGSDILLGGGSSTSGHGNTRNDPSKVISPSISLLQLAVEGKDGVSAKAAVKFTKLAFSHEHWDAFDAVIPSVISFVQSQDDPTCRKEEMDLMILLAMQPLLSGRKPKHGIAVQQSHNNEEHICGGSLIFEGESIQTGGSLDDLVILAETVFLCVSNPSQAGLPDKDLIVSVVMFLWQRCKPPVHRIQPSGSDGSKFIHKFEENSKWVHILLLLQEVVLRCNMVDIDVSVITEVALRLAGLFENLADSVSKCGKSDKVREHPDFDSSVQTGNHSTSLFLKKSPLEQLFLAYNTLEKAIHGMAVARSVNTLQDVSSIIDYYCTKPVTGEHNLRNTKTEDENPSEPFLRNSLLMDLHLELIHVQHGVSVKLLNLIHGGVTKQTSCSSACTKGPKACLHFFTEEYILNKINKNKISKAIFLMQKAALGIKKGLIHSSTQISEEVLALIHKAETEERAVYTSCIKHQSPGNVEKNAVPPPPILLSRTDCSMLFKPAPFSSDVKVSWYCLFGRQVTGEAKARLNDYNLPCTGEEIPATEDNLLEVKGLKANEKYVFAVAAYSADGNLIGDAVGRSTKPILAYPPLSTLVSLAYLVQMAYQKGNYKVVKKAFSVLWDYFVSTSIKSSPEDAVDNANNIFSFSNQRMSMDAVSHASPVLLQLFLRSIFIANDVSVKEGALFCDRLCTNGSLYKWQVKRIKECGKLLIALDLCTWLNDFNHALQAVVQIYGLLVPIIYHRIPSKSAMQILIKSLVVLQEIPSSTWQRKQSACVDSVLHMTACTVYYMAQILRSWDEYELAKAVIQCGKRLLDSSDSAANLSVQLNKVTSNEDFEVSFEEKIEAVQPDLVKKNAKKPTSVIVEKVNEQLAALEANLLKITKPFSGTVLTGNEDPILLHSVVTCWPTKQAFKELIKFKNKIRFVEFFVQLLHREVYDEHFQQVIEWANTVQNHLTRRNELLLGNKKNLGKEIGEVTVSGEAFKRYTAVLVEYQKNREPQTPKQTRKETLSAKQKEKHKKLNQKNIPAKACPDLPRKSAEEVEKRAFTTLVVLLTPIVRRYIKRKRVYQSCMEEMPWKSQMNIILAFAHFSLLHKHLEQMPKDEFDLSQSTKSYNALDPEIFFLHNSGTVVIGTEATTDNENALLFHSIQHLLKSDVKKGAKSLRDSDDFSEKSAKMSEMDTPRTQRTNETAASTSRSIKEQEKQNALRGVLLDHFFKMFLHLKRAVVLAHRGGHWTLLHNACRILWNFTLELQSIVENLDSVQRELFPVTMDTINYVMWLPFYLASDMIFDMIIALQKDNSLQVTDAAGEFSVPSSVGSIADDDGGSSLTFEYPFDDINIADLRFVSDIVLRTIEVLYHMKKWETLVYIAMQFNIITHERYSEKVTPLLVYAQRHLIVRIQQFNGPNVPQPHFINYTSEHGVKVNSRNFIGKQLHVATKSKDSINPGGHIDPEGHNIYEDGKRAKSLVCVPLDVKDSLKFFRESLNKSKYTSRALKHSRKLLSLFLSQIQGTAHVGTRDSHCTLPGKVAFSTADTEVQQPVPPDLSEEKFISPIAVQSKGLPHTQISVVILSYEKTIEILHGNNQPGLKAQALHELGNLHMYARHKRAAFQCWCQALDEILKAADILNTWQTLGSASDSATKKNVDVDTTDYSEIFLHRAGIWGCLQAAVLTTKISQYILTSDLKMRTECCILSAFLFKSLFRASFPHPKADRNYALYEIGEQCDVRDLIPGIDLFSDRYRADIATVVASLDFLIYELYSCQRSLMVLPLCTLYQYFVTTICHDPVRCIEGRILKINALTDLKFYTEAFSEINQLNDGIKIPKYHLEGYRPFTKSKDNKKFDSSKSLLADDNKLALEALLNKSPSTTLTSLCEHQIMKKFDLAKMHFIISISSTINVIPETVKRSSYSVIDQSSVKGGVKTEGAPTEEDEYENWPVIVQLISKEELSLARIKGILLTEAEVRLTRILEEIKNENSMEETQKENISSPTEFSAPDLEVVVDAQLMLAAIAQQRHQTALSAAMAFATIQLFRDANIFMTHVVQPTHVVKLAAERKGQIQRQDPGINDPQLPFNEEVQNRMTIRLWMRCRLALVTALMTQIRGIGAVKEEKLLDCCSLINEGILEAETFGDIEMLAEMMLNAALLDLQGGWSKRGIKLLLKLIRLGEAVEQHTDDPVFMSPVQTLRNIYLPHINLLAKIKLRIGNTLAHKAPCAIVPEELVSFWLTAHKLLETALELCRLSSSQEFDLEAEIIFQKANVESRLLRAGCPEMLTAFETFGNAIDISRRNYQHFGLIRSAYLEIARLYFHLITLESNSKEDTSSTQTEVITKGSIEIVPTPAQTYKLLAWMAIRAATQVDVAMIACKKLIEHDIATTSVEPVIQQYIPSFVSVDLLKTYKDFLSEECKVIHESLIKKDKFKESPNDPKNNDEKQQKIENPEEGYTNFTLSWIHIIRYYNNLRRLISRFNLANVSETIYGAFHPDHVLRTSVFNTGLSLRITAMHFFLKMFMKAYLVCCVDEPPKELLQNFEKPFTTLPPVLSLLSVSVKVNGRRNGKEKKVLKMKLSSTKTSEAKVNEQGSMANSSSDKELCFQWYRPAFEKSEDGEPKILLFYAYNTTTVKINNLKTFNTDDVVCGQVSILLARITSLHEKLCLLKEEVVNSVQPISESENEEEAIEENSETDFETEIQFTEKLEELLKQVCSEVQELLAIAFDVQPHIQVPDEPSMMENGSVLLETESSFDSSLLDAPSASQSVIHTEVPDDILMVPDGSSDFRTESYLSSALTDTPTASEQFKSQYEAPFDVSVQSIINLEEVFDPAHGGVIVGGTLFEWIMSLLY
ncbi:cilia- and flagella-associated protein 54 isoform X2 [Lissotriton helveticus]